MFLLPCTLILEADGWDFHGFTTHTLITFLWPPFCFSGALTAVCCVLCAVSCFSATHGNDVDPLQSLCPTNLYPQGAFSCRTSSCDSSLCSAFPSDSCFLHSKTSLTFWVTTRRPRNNISASCVFRSFPSLFLLSSDFAEQHQSASFLFPFSFSNVLGP